MIEASTSPVSSRESRPVSQSWSAVLAIAVGGGIAGVLDLTQALILFGVHVPLGIAAGLLGLNAARQGGTGTYILGILLHFFIASSFAAAYYLASRRLRFLVEHPLVCGMVYGMIVELVMDLAILPLSALHAVGPYELRQLLLGIGVHMVTVGLPIAYSVRRFGR
jgi:Na+/alanine symporter